MIRLSCRTFPPLGHLLRSATERSAAEGDYWNPSGYYQFERKAVETLLRPATEDLWAMCRDFVGRAVADAEILASLGIAEHLWDGIRESWLRDDPVALARFDLSFDGSAAPKLHECNIDVVGLLFEATLFQSRWFQHQKENDRSFRDATHCAGIEDGLAAVLTSGGSRAVMLASLAPDPYDALWIETLSAILAQRGATCARAEFASVEALCRAVARRSAGNTEPAVVKSFRWDAISACRDSVPGLVAAAPRLFSPMWSVVLSSKGCLPWLWRLYPGHPNLLPAFFDAAELAGSRGIVAKPLFSIQGQNVTLEDRMDCHRSMATDGPDQTGRRIFQELCYLPDFDVHGRRWWASTGAWIVNERFAALSMTECSSPVINGPHMRYLPHVLAT